MLFALSIYCPDCRDYIILLGGEHGSLQIYVNINNLQHVKNALVTVPQTLQVSSIIAAIDGPSPSSLLDIPR